MHVASSRIYLVASIVPSIYTNIDASTMVTSMFMLFVLLQTCNTNKSKLHRLATLTTRAGQWGVERFVVQPMVSSRWRRAMEQACPNIVSSVKVGDQAWEVLLCDEQHELLLVHGNHVQVIPARMCDGVLPHAHRRMLHRVHRRNAPSRSPRSITRTRKTMRQKRSQRRNS